ncbi:MAG: phosphotransferase family protein [Actinomycetota bacterium]
MRERLAPWLAERLGATGVELTDLGGPAFSGYSNETLLLEAAWDEGGERHTRGLCVRLEPTEHRVFHDTLFETQVRVMRALGATIVPVPDVLWLEEDPSILGAPFFVMGLLHGQAPPDNPPYHGSGWLHDATPELRSRVWLNGLDVMASIHRLDPHWAGVTFLDVVDAGGHLARDRAYAEWVLQGRPYPIIEEAFAKLAAAVPGRDVRPALVWGDARIGNILFDDHGTVEAVLDWEMVTIGNPVAALAWFMLLDRPPSEAVDVPRLPGLPSREETVARWEAKSAYDARDLEWWELLGATRFAAIMTRVLDLLDDSGTMPGARATMSLDNTATKLLRIVLDEGRV